MDDVPQAIHSEGEDFWIILKGLGSQGQSFQGLFRLSFRMVDLCQFFDGVGPDRWRELPLESLLIAVDGFADLLIVSLEKTNPAIGQAIGGIQPRPFLEMYDRFHRAVQIDVND